MNKKVVSLLTAALVIATTIPVFAAPSPTASSPTAPVTVPAAVAAARGGVSASEQAAIATSPVEAAALQSNTALTTGGTVGVGVEASVIAVAKLDILKNAGLRAAIAAAGGAGQIVGSKFLANPNGSEGTKRVTLRASNVAPGQKVVVMYYKPMDLTPRYMTVTVGRNGTVSANLPLPCAATIIK